MGNSHFVCVISFSFSPSLALSLSFILPHNTHLLAFALPLLLLSLTISSLVFLFFSLSLSLLSLLLTPSLFLPLTPLSYSLLLLAPLAPLSFSLLTSFPSLFPTTFLPLPPSYQTPLPFPLSLLLSSSLAASEPEWLVVAHAIDSPPTLAILLLSLPCPACFTCCYISHFHCEFPPLLRIPILLHFPLPLRISILLYFYLYCESPSSSISTFITNSYLAAFPPLLRFFTNIIILSYYVFHSHHLHISIALFISPYSASFGCAKLA